MTLDDIGNLAELFAAIGVMVSLIYLALQIRRNSETERMETYRSIVSDFGALNQSIASDPEVALLFARGMEDYAERDETDKARLSQYFYSTFRYFENMFYQRNKGYLEDEVWIGWQRLILTYFKRPGFQAWWQHRRPVFNPTFVEFLENSESDVELVSYYEITRDDANA